MRLGISTLCMFAGFLLFSLSAWQIVIWFLDSAAGNLGFWLITGAVGAGLMVGGKAVAGVRHQG